MYAIIKTGSKQFRVSVGDKIDVERLAEKTGAQVTLSNVLLVERDGNVQVGNPNVTGASVVAKVLGENKGAKVIHFDYRNKHRRRKTHGHRQMHTRLEIAEIRV